MDMGKRKALAFLGLIAIALSLYFLVIHGKIGGMGSSKGPTSLTAERILVYQGCGCEILQSQETLRAQEKESYLASLGEGWFLGAQGDKTMEIKKSVKGDCPNHENTRLLTITGGCVTLYRGCEPKKEFLHRKFPELEEGLLGLKDRELLKAGVLVQGDGDVPVDIKVSKYLEGLLD